MYQLKTILVTLISATFLLLSVTWIITKTNIVKNNMLPIIKNIPSFSLNTQDGYIFSETDLIGKVTVLDFMFTSCAGPCPVMASNMKKLYNQYQSKPEVQFVSITVDPYTDTEEVLKQYALAYGVKDERWQFLTGEIDAIKSLSQDGFLLFADNLPAGHAIKFVLIDNDGKIRKYYDGTDEIIMDDLINDLEFLLKEIKT